MEDGMEENDCVACDREVRLEQQRVACKTASKNVWFQKSPGVVEEGRRARTSFQVNPPSPPLTDRAQINWKFSILPRYTFQILCVFIQYYISVTQDFG